MKLTYVLVDDRMHRYAEEMVKMMDTLSSHNVRNVVLHDGWLDNDTNIYRLRTNEIPPEKRRHARRAASTDTVADPSRPTRAERTPLAPTVPEVASNNPSVMAKVLRWTLRENRGSKKFLHFMGHGGGVYGMGTDDHQVDPRQRPFEQPLLRR